jgi:hypothetical protein
MKNRKTIAVLALILAIILAGAFFRAKITSVLKNESNFRVTDTASVNRIEILSDDSIVITRTSGGWILNGTEPASNVAVNNLLFSFTLIKVKGVNNDPGLSGMKGIRLRISEGRKIHRYRFYSMNGVSFLQKEGSRKLSAVEVYGHPDIDPAAVIDPLKDRWREKMLIDLQAEEIREVSVIHPGNSAADFRIKNDNGKPLLYRIEKEQDIPVKETDEEKINFYLCYFTNIFYDRTDTSGFRPDTAPQWTVNVTDTAGRKYKLEVWPLRVNGENDMFRCLIRFNDSAEFREARFMVLDLTLQDIQHFLLN